MNVIVSGDLHRYYNMLKMDEQIKFFSLDFQIINVENMEYHHFHTVSRLVIIHVYIKVTDYDYSPKISIK